jgi:hypothetical protein
VPVVAAGALVLLFSIGFAQWTVLRAHVGGAGRWIWGTALAWTIALGLFVAVTTPLWQPGQPTAVTALVGVLGGLVMATAVAALTGWLAVRLTARTPPRYGVPPRRISPAARKPDSTAPSR